MSFYAWERNFKGFLLESVWIYYVGRNVFSKSHFHFYVELSLITFYLIYAKDIKVLSQQNSEYEELYCLSWLIVSCKYIASIPSCLFLSVQTIDTIGFIHSTCAFLYVIRLPCNSQSLDLDGRYELT